MKTFNDYLKILNENKNKNYREISSITLREDKGKYTIYVNEKNSLITLSLYKKVLSSLKEIFNVNTDAALHREINTIVNNKEVSNYISEKILEKFSGLKNTNNLDDKRSSFEFLRDFFENYLSGIRSNKFTSLK